MSPIVREYYRVPRGDRQTYIRPEPGGLPALVERNRRLAASYDFEFAGRPFQEFRAAARAEIVGLARRYTQRWGFAVDRRWSEPMPIITTGHQPPPFHPGVWIKNFLAGSLAAAVGGTALNLIVDNDEARGQVLRFPTRLSPEGNETGEVRAAEVAFASGGGAAFEEQTPEDLRLDALQEVIEFLPPACVGPFRHCLGLPAGLTGGPSSLGEVLSAARRQLEEELGLRNLELPVSEMADSTAFRLFVAEMIVRHEELFAAYNDSLAEYRRAYRERSAAQPVPDLARDGPRVESPLWVWRQGEKRRRLWVEPGEGPLAPQVEDPLRRAGRLTGLFADHERIADLDHRARREGGGLSEVAAQLADLRAKGWKIRPRALALTLFVRAAVGDVFIHGLGGALYDKITDGLFERLLGVRPPEIVLASCTVRLALAGYPSAPADLAAARRAVRQWRFNPDRVLSEETRLMPAVAALMDEKRRLIAGMPAALREARRQAYLRTHEINQRLARFAPQGPDAARAHLVRVQRELHYNAVLWNREYPFCLYPAEDLAAFYREATHI